MTNYIHRLAITTSEVIREKITTGIAWDIADFRELVLECEKQNIDRRKTRGLVLDILKMIPRIDSEGRGQVWKEVSAAFLPAKEYTVTKINMETATAAEVSAHMAKVFAAKFKEMSL